MSEPSFSSQEDAIRYYKTLALEYKRRFSDVQQELEEFQEGSRDLETELEAQLTQAEAKNKELAAANSQLKVECERLQMPKHTPVSFQGRYSHPERVHHSSDNYSDILIKKFSDRKFPNKKSKHSSPDIKHDSSSIVEQTKQIAHRSDWNRYYIIGLL
ncbi:hypothetical protein TNCV_3430941 [Trichonephila clavipes]|nr:hypothetical protein TNCV_3430941 [Trichonephila clavipes]